MLAFPFLLPSSLIFFSLILFIPIYSLTFLIIYSINII